MSANYRKSENTVKNAILELLPIYGEVKILVVATFGLIWHFCANSYPFSDSWVSFTEILVNLNTFGL